MAPRFTYIGMGGMAKAMTRNLVRSGKLDQPLILYNRTQSTAQVHSHEIGHSMVASTIKEAVSSSDIIWLSLQDDDAVDSIINQVAQGEIRGKLFVDSSSISPGVTRSMAATIEKLGGDWISMPVMGEPSMAATGNLWCVAAGRRQALERIRPYVVGTIGHTLIELTDEPPERASLVKLMGNVMILMTMETVAELNAFAEKSGAGVANTSKLLTAMFPNQPHSIYNKRMLSGDYYQEEPVVELHKAIKLASHVMQLAETTGTSIPGYEVAFRHLKASQDHAGPNIDISSIYGAVRRESGLPFENSGSSEVSQN